MITVEERISKFRSKLLDQSLDFGIVMSPENVCYLAGYAAYPFGIGQNCLIIPVRDEAIFVAQDAEKSMAPKGFKAISYESFDIHHETHAIETLVKAVSAVIQRKSARIGIETQYLSSAVREALAAELSPSCLADLTSIIQELRIRKDADEIKRIRESVGLAEVGVQVMLERARPGVREIDIFSELSCRMEMIAGKPVDAYTDLISGDKCLGIGYPLAVASTKKLADGEDVICDVLVRMDGYYGDLTRTKHLGVRTSKQEDIYLAVKDAERAVINRVKPGVLARDLDATAREVIHEHGFDLPHYTGHGFGLHYREEPILVSWNNRKLEPGMVFTVEPGVYVPGEGHVRLEDNLLVTESGCEVLSNLPYEL
jgi:Xaa-Pro dipeptidase